MPAIETEIEKLHDYQAAFEYSKKSQAELAQMIQAKEKEMLGVQQTSSQLGKEAAELEGQLKSIEAVLHISEDEYLVQYAPDQPINVKDIVRGKVEEYKTSRRRKVILTFWRRLSSASSKNHNVTRSGCSIWSSIFQGCAMPRRMGRGQTRRIC